MQKLTLALVALSFSLSSYAQSYTGTWQTKDDETGEIKSHIQIEDTGGKWQGKIVKILRKNAPANCEKCPGERKNQPLMGMTLLVNMAAKGGMLEGGDILDPEKGKWYRCKMWLKEGDPNTLVVRGYLGPFYRTQYWTRVN
jgi:uncharacterized protein (DUF2147 family)